MALTDNAMTFRLSDQSIRRFPLAATTRVYRGAMVCLNSAGYLVNAAPGLLFLGMAAGPANNASGAAGDVNCNVFMEGDFSLAVAGIAVADAGRRVYATDENTFSLSPTNAVCIGRVIHRDDDDSGRAIVRLESALSLHGNIIATCVEIDCEEGTTPSTIVAIPANLNENGMLIVFALAIVTEVFGGMTEDQGILSIQDTAVATLNLTFTATNGGVDSVGDGLQEGGSNDTGITASTGDALAIVPAGLGVQVTRTQATSGAGAAGKMKIVVWAMAI